MALKGDDLTKCLWVSYTCDEKFYRAVNAVLKHDLKEDKLDALFQNLKQNNLKSIPEENEVIAVE
jgi:hypothetical protein